MNDFKDLFKEFITRLSGILVCFEFVKDHCKQRIYFYKIYKRMWKTSKSLKLYFMQPSNLWY